MMESNPRHEAAVRFAARARREGDVKSMAAFVRHLTAYLYARDIAYPEHRKLPVNLKQCIAIALPDRKVRRRTQPARKRRPFTQRKRKAA